MTIIRRLVPNFIIEKYKSNEMRGSFQSAAIFVDLSGFSKMTDVLSGHGQAGAEALADLMRLVFEPLVNTVYEQGGFVIGFAGDAFNAVFPEDTSQPNHETLRCLAALITMQKHMQANPAIKTPFGSFSISIKAGMGFGETRWQMFKSETGAHLSYWLRGDSLNRAVRAEEQARAGDIIIDPVALNRIQDDVEVENMTESVRVVKILTSLPAPASFLEPEPDPAPMNIFFPEALSRQKIVGEFRHVINMFIDIPINISDEALVAPFMQTVYDLQERFGGFFLRPDLGDKGFNLLLFWGAPIAREKDVERALQFITELAARTKLSLRAGITYRLAYAGFMGAPLREDYTAYGWGVNLAARLMEHAGEGEFWIDAEIAQRAEMYFEVKFLGDYVFKGFSNKQPTYQLIGKKNSWQALYAGKMTGRQKELHQLAALLIPLRENKFAGITLITGEAGMGKSRLLQEFQDSKIFNDQPIQWIFCQAEEIIQDAFNPFKNWLRKRFHITEGLSDETNWQTFSQEIEVLATITRDIELAFELRRSASILAALINITQPGTLYETLDAKSRYENTLIALSVLFRVESLQKPLILLLEDIHWLDNDTAIFLNYFIRTLKSDAHKNYPIAILATRRPQGNLLQLENIQEIKLSGLTNLELEAIAQNILEKPASSELTKILELRAEGNPFFAEQILRYLLENQLLTPNAHGQYTPSPEADKALPVDVYAVMTARLDRLSQQVRETVQTASVLGREFVVDVLVKMLHDQKEKLPQYVYDAEKADIWISLEEINYIFRHAMLRDAAYSMQLTAQKSALHKLAFQALEELYANDLEPIYSELAYHAERGNLPQQAQQYLQQCANHAISGYQNQQAIDFLTRALACTPQNDLRLQFELLIKRVECSYNLGDTAQQQADLKHLEELAQHLQDQHLLARTMIRYAFRASTLGNYPDTIHFANQAKDLAQASHDTETLLSVYVVLPDALTHAGKAPQALQTAQEGVALARQLGNRAKEASSLSALGLVTLGLQGHAAAQTFQEQALQLARDVKDRFLEAKILNNIALSITAQGDYHLAREYFQAARVIFHEQGNQSGKGLSLANLGWLSSILGDYPTALKFYEQALTINREQGAQLAELYTYINLSASANGQNNAAEALQWAETALAFAIKTQDKVAQAWAYFYLAHAHLLEKNYTQSMQGFQKSIEIHTETKSDALVIEAKAGLMKTCLEMHDQASAEKEAQHILLHIEKDPALNGTEEPLRIFLYLIQYLEQTKDPRKSNLLQLANELLNAQVSKLRSHEARQMFVENVPWRRELRQMAA